MTEGPWLLVLDNALSEDSIKPYIPKETTAGSIIVTTNSINAINMWRGQFDVKVRQFSSEEGAGFLLDRLNVRERFENHRLEDTFQGAERISELLRGMPFAIELAANIINKSKCTLSAFEGRFSERHLSRPFETVLGIVLRDCKPESRALLDCLSFLNTYEIQEDLVFRDHEHPSLKFLGFADSSKLVIFPHRI